MTGDSPFSAYNLYMRIWVIIDQILTMLSLNKDQTGAWWNNWLRTYGLIFQIQR